MLPANEYAICRSLPTRFWKDSSRYIWQKMNLGSYVLCLFILFTSCKQNDKAPASGYVKIMNTNIYYEAYGNGMPVLLLSGGGLQRSIHDFDSIIPLLSKTYRVVAPDSPGQGKSDQPDSLSYIMLTEYFSQLIDSLKLDSVYVMGWSDGGIAALLLAEKRPDKVKKLIAVGANYTLSGALPPGIDISTVVPQQPDAWEAGNKEVVQRYKEQPNRDWKKMKTELDEMWYQHEYFPKSVLTNISIPTLIVLGDKDDIVPEHGLDMHRQIKNSQFCVLPNTTHDVFAESPRLINEVALKFFKQ